LTVSGTLFRMCTAVCQGSGPGSARCEQPESGNVRAACAGSFCLLVDCEGRECPAGTECETTFGQGNSGRMLSQCIPD
jgi:hypothetical protein